MHAIIIGAGPAGLASALALHQQSTLSSPITITVLELRPTIQTLGGAVNLTPLAMRYLDSFGVGSRLRPLGVKVSYIDIVSLRTGTSLGKLWPDVDAIRVLRHQLVHAMVETVRAVPDGGISLRYGVSVTKIEEQGDPSGDGSVKVTFVDNTNTASASGTGKEETIEGDVIIGCDGIHSFVRSEVVDPHRKKTYSGRANAYGYISVPADREAGDAGVTMADGTPAVKVSTLVSGQLGSMLITFFEPELKRIYLANVIAQPEALGEGDGKKVVGEDKEAVKADFLRRFRGGRLGGLEDAIKRCEEWVSFPVYMLPPGGVWSKGRSLLLGDAAHAMPPQGESTGVAIEDSTLLARVFSRRDTRSIEQLFSDYEALRRPVIKKTYDETMFRWNGVSDKSWFMSYLMEWLSMVYIWIMNNWSKDNFGRDVRNLDLPA